MKTAYEQGLAAYNNGVKLEGCPYHDSPEYEEWVEGWTEAQSLHKGEIGGEV